ncbi:MAG: V-type ATP synthase subunit C [Ruminococcaceae bacterium]|nr:V-type ATP synthase subunit C [Oscillospiraceae bacterium]
MAKKIKDVDYLGVSARVRALENELLTAEKLDQLLAAKDNDELSKLLQSFGYGELDPRHPEALDADLTAVRAEALEDLAAILPDPGLLDVFKIKYDYHNVKALLKAEAMNVSTDGLLADLGRVRVEELAAAVRENAVDNLPGCLGETVREGREVLSSTRDPQLCDVAVDKQYFRDMLQTAEETDSAFLAEYVRLQLDAVNLRTLVRTLRMGKNTDFLRGVLIAGGGVDPDELLRVCANGGNGLAELYAPTRLAEAAEEGAAALRGGLLTEFEKRCDDAVSAFLADTSLIPFGEEPVLAYLAALETEYTNLRIILMGRAALVPADVIRSRLRAGCV